MIRSLTSRESENFTLLKKFSKNISLIILTPTGLDKSIMDATYSVRLFLKENNIHDFNRQESGQDNKKNIESFYYFENKFYELSASLYRPMTKDGDPRIWFCGIKEFVKADCALALIAVKKKIYILNLSDETFSRLLSREEEFRNFLENTLRSEDAIAIELLKKMHEIHKKGWIKTVVNGDTGVGATLEHLLDIRINSSKAPDYKGIELKAYRKGKKGKVETRSNLFAQVADWCISPIDSSARMLEKYGYDREAGRRKLYCTVSSKVFNSQGLKFEIDENREILIERHKTSGPCMYWPFKLLIERLKEKHSETFWIEAEVRLDSRGREEFLYTKVIHTKSPILSELIPLIGQGLITMDHLISSRDGKKIAEKGPLFKINKKNLGLIFPEPRKINFCDLE